MAKIRGKWKWKSMVSCQSPISTSGYFAISFTSGGRKFVGINSELSDKEHRLVYMQDNSGGVIVASHTHGSLLGGAFLTIDGRYVEMNFGAISQEIDDDFYEFFIANASECDTIADKVQYISENMKTVSKKYATKKSFENVFLGTKGGAPGAGYFNDYDGAIAHNRAEGRASTAFGYNNQILAGHTEWCPSEFTPTEKTTYGYHGFVAGGNNKVTGYSSVALGEGNEVVGQRAVAAGYFLKAYGGRQFVCGVCNEPDIPVGNNPDQKGKYAVIVGGGTTAKRKNIFTVDWNGNVTSTGTFKATNANGVVIDLLAKIEELEKKVAALEAK